MHFRFEWTTAREQRLIELFNEHQLTIAQIAGTLGCSVSSVRNKLGRLREKGLVGHKRAPTRGPAKGGL